MPPAVKLPVRILGPCKGGRRRKVRGQREKGGKRVMDGWMDEWGRKVVGAVAI